MSKQPHNSARVKFREPGTFECSAHSRWADRHSAPAVRRQQVAHEEIVHATLDVRRRRAASPCSAPGTTSRSKSFPALISVRKRSVDSEDVRVYLANNREAAAPAVGVVMLELSPCCGPTG